MRKYDNIYLPDEFIQSVYEHKRIMCKNSDNLALYDYPIEFFIADYIYKFCPFHAHTEDKDAL